MSTRPGWRRSWPRAGTTGRFRFDGSPGELARTIIGGLEGAMLLARPYGDIARFEAAASHLVRDLVA